MTIKIERHNGELVASVVERGDVLVEFKVTETRTRWKNDVMSLGPSTTARMMMTPSQATELAAALERMVKECERMTAESKQWQERVQKQTEAVDEDYAKPGRVSDTGYTIPCPACGEVLTYVISGFNGHWHVWCSNEKCASWME